MGTLPIASRLSLGGDMGTAGAQQLSAISPAVYSEYDTKVCRRSAQPKMRASREAKLARVA